MSPSIATARTVDRDELLEFVRSRHRGLLATSTDATGARNSRR